MPPGLVLAGATSMPADAPASPNRPDSSLSHSAGNFRCLAGYPGMSRPGYLGISCLRQTIPTA